MTGIDKILQPALGATFQELIAEGERDFPELPVGSRHHASAARRASERFGFVPSQLLGAGVELAEGLNGADIFTQDTLDDFKANVRGGLEGSVPGRAIKAVKGLRRPRTSRPSASIPRGKHGGRMTAEATKSGRNVARQHFAVGGASGASRLGKSTSESETDTSSRESGNSTTEESGTGFTQNIANTGALDNIISQLRGVQGFSNIGRSTLDDTLRTGLPTDVSGITEAAKIRAGQEFDDASNVIGERLANLGLVSSSAQTTAVARERAKLGERVAAAGLEAKVAAAEAAAARRVAGIGLDTSGQSVQAGALGQAGSLAASSAELNKRIETGFQQSGSSSTSRSSTGSSKTSGSAVNPLFGTTLPSSSGSFSTTPSSSGGSGISSSAPRERERTFASRLNKAAGGVPMGSFAFNDGGRVPELDDVLQGTLETATRTGGGALTVKDRLARERALIGRFEEDNIGLQNSRQEIGEFLAENDPGILQMLLGGPGGAGALNADQAFLDTNVDAREQANIDRAATSALDRARGPGVNVAPASKNRARSSGFQERARENFALGGPVEGDPEPIGAPNKGAVPQPTLPQEAGQVIPGLLDPRRQFFEDGGGVAPGIDSGEDKVPAMLRSEELVITPELTDELMNVDPELPQPGLITALQQLAQQPLEFGEEEGELVAAEGGSVGLGQFFQELFSGSRGLSPEERTRAFQSFLSGPQGDLIAEDAGLTSFGVTPGNELAIEAQGFDLPPGPPSALTDLPPGPDASNFVPFGGGADAFQKANPAPGAPRPPSLTESVGEAGERSFTLDGGDPGAGPLGAEGIRAGLDPSKGILEGGNQFAPGVSRQIPGSIGTISGSAAIIDPDTGLPADFSGEQLSRVDRAQRIADLTRSAIRTDPIGGPEKQARMLRALEAANREVDSAVNEMIQGEQLAIQRKQVQNAGIVAEGQLNASIAETLAAQARKITAEGALAKQILEAQANNPVLTAALNALEVLAKNPDADDQTRDQTLAILQFQLQQAGIELTESGFLQKLFGAPGFEIGRSTPEQGIPTQVPNGRQGFADGGIVQPDGEAGQVAVVNDGQQELQALMSRAKAGMSAEDFQHIMEIM